MLPSPRTGIRAILGLCLLASLVGCGQGSSREPLWPQSSSDHSRLAGNADPARPAIPTPWFSEAAPREGGTTLGVMSAEAVPIGRYRPFPSDLDVAVFTPKAPRDVDP